MNNFNFKDNWGEIYKRLEYHSVQCVIKSSIKKYLRETNFPLTYDKELLPCHYSQGDAWTFIVSDEEKDKLRERLTIDGTIEKDLKFPNYKKILKKCRNDKTKADAIYDEKYEKYLDSHQSYKYETYCNEKMKPYIDEIMKNNYKSYKLRSGCHYWNNTFSLKMANYIFPKENWEVISNHLHTTVVNKNRTKVFDILMYNENADDFGGDEAYRYATFEGNIEQWLENNNILPDQPHPTSEYQEKSEEYFNNLIVDDESDIETEI